MNNLAKLLSKEEKNEDNWNTDKKKSTQKDNIRNENI